MTHSLRSPLGRAKGLGSAKDGFKHWWVLRLTSVPLIPLFFYFVSQADALKTVDRGVFMVWASEPLNAVALLVFIVCGFYHACLGMAEIIVDYLPHEGVKIAALILNKLFFFGLGVASLYAVIRL